MPQKLDNKIINCDYPFPYKTYAQFHQNFNLLLFMFFTFVCLIKLVTNKKYALFWIYEVRLSTVNHNLKLLDKMDRVLLQIPKSDRWGNVHCRQYQQNTI